MIRNLTRRGFCELFFRVLSLYKTSMEIKVQFNCILLLQCETIEPLIYQCYNHPMKSMQTID